jgi:hypothetical protein
MLVMAFPEKYFVHGMTVVVVAAAAGIFLAATKDF